MVGGGIGKAQEALLLQGVFQLLVPEEIRQQAEGVVPADGREDQVHLLIPEGLQKVCRPGLGMGLQISRARQGVIHELHLDPAGLQALQPQLQLVLFVGLSQHAVGERDDADASDSPCRHLTPSFPA